MTFNDFVSGQPDGKHFAHMNFDRQYAWDAKNDDTDQDNGFICKKAI